MRPSTGQVASAVAVLAVAALGPALARGANPGFTAYDQGMSGVWRSSEGGGTERTINKGGTVDFAYPGSTSAHNVVFTDAQPASCRQDRGPRPPGEPPPLPTYAVSGWSGSRTFNAPGNYPFVCSAHADMTGAVHVVDLPAATPAPPPGATPTPPPSGGGTPTRVQTPLTKAIRLAKTQRGTRVRGSVTVDRAASKLVIAVWARRSLISGGRSSAPVRIGRWTRASTAAGRVAFSVPLAAKARSALRRQRKLAVTVSFALTPPGAKTLGRRVRATLRAA